MSEQEQLELALASPGAMLKSARLAADLDARDAADQLHWLPNYVGVIESDDYQALRNPAFARGYVRAYGKLLGVNEIALLSAFDERQAGEREALERRRIETRPLHLQRTGKGVVIGLTTLLLLVVALWWQGGRSVETPISHPAILQLEQNTETQLSVGES